MAAFILSGGPIKITIRLHLMSKHLASAFSITVFWGFRHKTQIYITVLSGFTEYHLCIYLYMSGL